jgi:YD repeat-containing protein
MNALTSCLCILTLLSSLPSLASAAVTYTYDARMRLTRAAYDTGVAVEYTYDITDNRLTKTSTGPSSQTYEDGEAAGNTGWDIYDNDPVGATISKVFNPARNSNVVQFTGSGTANGYRLRSAGEAYWNDTNFKVLQWDMNYSESFTVYIAVQTKKGFRYLTYTPVNTDTLGNGTYISYGLGTNIQNGQWHTVYRDLAYDIRDPRII